MKIHFFLKLVCCAFLISPLIADNNQFVLVTGGAGYIGSHACKALSEAGFIPVTYDSLKAGSKDLVKWGPLVIGNLLNIEELDRVFSTYKPFAVLHFAGVRNVGESVLDPSKYYDNNVVGSINLLNMIVNHGVKYIVFSSSCTVYGNTSSENISEETSKNPMNPYGRSKHIIENAIVDYADAYGLKYMTLRYFNAAGIDVDAGLKRVSSSRNFLIPRALDSLINLDRPLEIFGTDYTTYDGTCVRDYIHVKDLANAHVLALQHLINGLPSNQVNLGSGKGYSIFEIIREIENLVGRKIPYEIKARRNGDAAVAIAKTDKAKQILGFEPRSSDLKMILLSEWRSVANCKQNMIQDQY